MPKNYHFSFKISLTLLFFLFIVQFAFAQNVQNDLNTAFKKFDLIEHRQVSFQRNQNSQKLSIQTGEKTFEFDLVINDLRSPSYFAEETSENGTRRIENTPIKTYKGKISGETNSEVRLTIDDAKIEGFFDSNGVRFFIEPAQRYSRFADKNDLVIYRAGDLVYQESFDCESGIASKIERGREMVSANTVNSPQTVRVIEIAVDADFEYSLALGGANLANSEILSILNMTEGAYETELRLAFRVVYQHVWTTQDPFAGVNTPTLLSSFQNYWNVNHTNIQRDTVHLFTGKGFALSSGYALIGEICDRNNAYGLSGYVNWSPAKFLITAHELGHNLGANHVGGGQSCDNTLMNEQLSFNTPLSFCSFSRIEINNFVNSSGSCLTNLAKSPFDFDGDSRTDISIFRPAQGEWWYLKSSTGGNSATQFGNSNDKLVPADFTGDGKTDIALFRPADGSWFVLRSEDNSFYSFPFGTSSDIPVAADFDGDGKADVGVFRPTNQTWFVSKSTGGTLIQQFGIAGDVPTVGDYDGDNMADIAIYRPSLGEWWISRSSNGLIAVQFGNSNDKPVQGDFTGDGKTDVALFRPADGNWFVLRSEDGSFYAAPFGANGDIPAAGDYDGDGKFDFAVFRPSNQTWFADRSTAGTLIQQFGIAGDKPIPAVFVP